MIILYSTNCSNCGVLERALERKQIKYEKVIGEDAIIKKGFASAPILEIDGKTFTFFQALEYLKTISTPESSTPSEN